MLSTRLLPLLALLLAACFTSNEGQRRNAQFTYDVCLFGCDLATLYLAAGGARAGISVAPASGIPQFTSVSTSNPEVATFARSGTGHVTVTTAQPGAADLILLDGTGKEIDRATVTVKPTTTLAFDKGWGNAMGPTVLGGSSHLLHTTTRNGDDILVGTGAVKFTLSGTIRPGDGVLLFGDSISFVADPGAGGVAGDCIDAHIVIPVTAVATGSLTSVELSPATITFARTARGKVSATVRAGQVAVIGAECTWSSSPAGLNAPSHRGGGTLGAGATSTWEFAGAAGTYTATCTAPNNLTASLAVKVE